MPSSSPSHLVQQVSTLLSNDHPGRLVVFVPRQQLGFALQHAVIRARGHTAGLSVTTLSEYAKTIAEIDLMADGKSEISAGSQFFLTAYLLRSLSPAQQTALTSGQSLTGIVSPLVDMFSTLREHGIDSETYKNRTSSSARHQAQAEAFSAYEDALKSSGFFDSATLFRRASTLLKENHLDLTGTHWALLDTVSLSAVKRDFVDSLRQASSRDPALHLLGPSPVSNQTSTSDENLFSPAPHPVAASQLNDVPRPSAPHSTRSEGSQMMLVPGTESSSTGIQQLQFWTATGTRREVQAVFEDLAELNRPLDTVEIAYTTPDPYLPLIDQMAERYDIPVSLSVGRSIEATRPGQALNGFFEWIANGGAMPDLIGLLRAGLLTIDRPIADAETAYGHLDSRRAASLLAQQRYAEDPTEHISSLTAWIERVEADLQTLKEEADQASWIGDRVATLREKLVTLRTLRSVVRTLLKLAHLSDHNSVPLRGFAASCETFLETFGPTPAPTVPEDKRTPDEVARNRLIERLQSLSRTGHDETYRPRRLASHMQSWISLSPYVRAQRPQPGQAHVVPLQSAGFANRKHLYVVGMDASSTSTTLPNAPLLSDEERETLSDGTRTLPRRTEEANVEDWCVRRALARHEGSLTLCANTYDVTEDEDLFESPLFLRLQEAAQASKRPASETEDSLVTHHSLAPDGERVFSRLDQWTARTPPSSDQVRETLSTHYPWIQDGLEAARARASESYTSYDGLLSVGPHPSLDPLTRSRPVTAGRLETYARSPFAYFLRYVLKIEPTEEPALDDVAWLDARRKGGILHETFRRFMSRLDRRPTLDDESVLRRVFEECLDECRSEYPPPSEVVYATVERELWNDALLFLRAEANQSDASSPHAFELGFGDPPHRRSDTDYEEAPTLHLGPLSFDLRGRIDRVDRLPDNRLQIWDYKTGSSRNYDETNLLDGAQHLQWALYGYALEALEEVDVATAGYFFTSTDEMGKRISASPSAYRDEVAQAVQQISEAITAGAFPLTDSDDLRYSFDQLFHSYSERRKELTAKDWPNDRPAPPSLREK